jgi:exodeoxyribonuclease VII small subunit
MLAELENKQPNFESVKTRLAEIADAIDGEGVELDEALDMYEEAVALCLKASDLLETGVEVAEEGDAGEEGGKTADQQETPAQAN